jgi:proline racemase
MDHQNPLSDKTSWQPPPHWTRITTIEMHTGGEPLRVFTSGLPQIEGRTVLEKRRYFREHYDHLRKATMWEPRGHADMYGAVLSPSLAADFDVFFLHNEGYSTMCGHAIIALTTLAVEAGWVQAADDSEVTLTFNVPAGTISARASVREGRAHSVSFRNVPSFVYLLDQEVDVTGIGRVQFDVAYGGAFYAVVDARSLGLELTPGNVGQLMDYGCRIKRAVMDACEIKHPFETDLGFLYGTILTAPAQVNGHHSRNVCVFADGEVDRSATGSGVSARAAVHYARGELALNGVITIESIVGSTMTVRVLEEVMFGPHEAIVPEVGGSSYLTGRNEFWFDPEDPLVGGFLVR